MKSFNQPPGEWRLHLKEYLRHKMEELSGNPYHDKETGRFAEAPGGSRANRKKAVKAVLDNPGGITVSPRTGKVVEGGYMVAGVLKPKSIPVEDIATPEGRAMAEAALLGWLNTNADKGVFDSGDIHLGGWFDKDTGRIEIEPSQRVLDRSTAESLGKRRHQKAIFDLNEFEEVSTGGTGRFIPNESPLKRVGDRYERKTDRNG